MHKGVEGGIVFSGRFTKLVLLWWNQTVAEWENYTERPGSEAVNRAWGGSHAVTR